MQFKRFFLGLLPFLTALPAASEPWGEPELGVSAGFSKLVLTDSAGTELKLSSTVFAEIRPKYTWILDPELHRFSVEASIQRITYEPPPLILSLTNKNLVLFGLRGSYIHPISRFALIPGLEVKEAPVADATDPSNIVLSHPLYFAGTFETACKLVVVERQVLWAGGGGKILVPSSSKEIRSGNVLLGYLTYELRGEMRTQLSALYEQRKLITRTGNQVEYNLLLTLRFGLPGIRGLTPPPDERD